MNNEQMRRPRNQDEVDRLDRIETERCLWSALGRLEKELRVTQVIAFAELVVIVLFIYALHYWG